MRLTKMKFEHSIENKEWYSKDDIILCNEGLRDFFLIPENCHKVVISLYDKPGTDRVKFYVNSDGDLRLGDGTLVELDSSALEYLKLINMFEKNVFVSVNYSIKVKI